MPNQKTAIISKSNLFLRLKYRLLGYRVSVRPETHVNYYPALPSLVGGVK